VRENEWMNIPVARATQTTVTKLVKNIKIAYVIVFEYAIAKATWTMYSGTNTVSISVHQSIADGRRTREKEVRDREPEEALDATTEATAVSGGDST
jgi:hypothetical protein